MFNHEALKGVVKDSITFREQQGYDLSIIKAQLSTIKETDCNAWLALYESIKDVPQTPGFSYQEPDDLEQIRSLRPNGPRKMEYKLADMELRDKIHGGVLGRICGVVLGRPVEGRKLETIEEFLRGADAYPLDNYFPHKSLVKGKIETICGPVRLRCVREYIKFAEADDDINYVILALKLIEKLGVNFTTLDVGYHWLDNLQVNWTWGPEHSTYMNLARYTDLSNRYFDIDPKTLWNVTHYLNDYQEYIGALIRGDVFGYVAAGLPEMAAEFAYRDAALTTVKNAIYGEMFASAMIAAAFCTNDIRKIVEIGLSEIPSNCRLSEAIRNTLKWYETSKDWREVYQHIDKHYNFYGPGHTINNAAIIVNGLLAGEGDVEKTLCITVMQGQDTDCTAATAGSVVGIINGATIFPQKWSGPLNDTVMSSILGESKNSISGLAQRIFNVGRMICKSQRKINYMYSEPE